MLQLNWWVATGTLFLEIALLGKLFSLLILKFAPEEFRKNYKQKFLTIKAKADASVGLKINEVLSDKFMLLFIFILSFFSAIMTLVYSEIFLQEPCSMCWFQRIFMYGIVVISGTALLAKNTLEQKVILKYIINFSVLGACFAFYQHMQQILAFYGTNLPCPVSGADCSKMIIYEYGHITFPWMAFVLFSLFIVVILLQRELKKD